mgnify:CR=1 FL=1
MRIALILLLFFFTPSFAQAQDIKGLWLTQNERSAIHIHECEDNKDAICGKVAWIIAGGMKYDSKNPDETLRERHICGLQILHGFEQSPEDPDKWVDGKIYKADDGEMYKANLKLLEGERLRVHGYVGIPLFGKTQIWQRTSEQNHPRCEPPKT